MSDRHPAILLGTALIVFVFCAWLIGQITLPWRGYAAGGVLALASGALIWFAQTPRQAKSRSFFSLGAAALAAPAAGLSAAQNDFLFGFIGDGDILVSRLDEYDRAMAFGLPALGFGGIAALVLFFLAWRMRSTADH